MIDDVTATPITLAEASVLAWGPVSVDGRLVVHRISGPCLRAVVRDAESRLAAATDLLESTAALSYCPTWLKTAIRAVLAAQPAAPTDDEKDAYDRAPSLLGSGNAQPAAPARTETPESRPGCTRADYYESKPARIEAETCECGKPGCPYPTAAQLTARTEAEQRVLAAVESLPERVLEDWCTHVSDWPRRIARAELARRGLK